MAEMRALLFPLRPPHGRQPPEIAVASIDSATSTSPTPSAGTLGLTLPSHEQSHLRR